jgi:hypothetical protein
MGFARQGSRPIVAYGIDVHWNAVDAVGGGRENVPAPLRFYKRQKVLPSFNLKLQFVYLFPGKNLSHGRRGFTAVALRVIRGPIPR